MSSRSRARRRWMIFFALLLLEPVSMWLRGYRVAGILVVRCREGHLFTTLWLPGVSLKSIRLGWWRVQWCPVGKHWSVVTPVRESELNDDERRSARDHSDIRIP